MAGIESLSQQFARGEKIAMLTCYDATFAKLMEHAGVDVLLVGDSLGMVLQGADNTLGVSLQDMLYHTRMVASGVLHTPIMADLPVGTYEHSHPLALQHARALLAAGAHMVKLEISTPDIIETVRYLAAHDVAVCAHLGFTPQAVNQLGGFKIQGKTPESAEKIVQQAHMVQAAGAQMLLLEMMPAALGKQVTEQSNIPTIGIGAGVDCDGQVLVLQDLLGIYTGSAQKSPTNYKPPRFAENFLQKNGSIQHAISDYVKQVKQRTFPGVAHAY